MVIGLLSFEFPPETGFGGIGTYTWYQARALARLGHEVHVIAGLKEPSALYTVQTEGVFVHRYRPSGPLMSAFHSLGGWKWWWTRQRLENGWSMFQALRILKRKHRFDVLEMPECGAEGYLINRFSGIPTVIKFHSPSQLIMPFYDVKPGDIRWCSFIERGAIRSATALTSCSSFLAGEVRSKMEIRAPIDVIPNGIDLALFDRDARDAVPPPPGWPKDKLTIFFAGRMERRKGIHLCGAIAQSILAKHDVAFVFAGEDLFGYMKDTLLPQLGAQKLRGSVHYLGKLDLNELRSCVLNAGIFLLPSLWENCPYSCLEAMAAGRAIVSSDQGGMPELIRDGENGLLARCDDPDSYVQQLERLIMDESLRRRLAQEARRTVEQNHTDAAIARRTLKVFERLTTRAPRGSRVVVSA